MFLSLALFFILSLRQTKPHFFLLRLSLFFTRSTRSPTTPTPTSINRSKKPSKKKKKEKTPSFRDKKKSTRRFVYRRYISLKRGQTEEEEGGVRGWGWGGTANSTGFSGTNSSASLLHLRRVSFPKTVLQSSVGGLLSRDVPFRETERHEHNTHSEREREKEAEAEDASSSSSSMAAPRSAAPALFEANAKPSQAKPSKASRGREGRGRERETWRGAWDGRIWTDMDGWRAWGGESCRLVLLLLAAAASATCSLPSSPSHSVVLSLDGWMDGWMDGWEGWRTEDGGCGMVATDGEGRKPLHGRPWCVGRRLQSTLTHSTGLLLRGCCQKRLLRTRTHTNRSFLRCTPAAAADDDDADANRHHHHRRAGTCRSIGGIGAW